jgi:putative heme iron utilization protein
MTFNLGDFHLYQLRFEKVRLVAGFGRALNVRLDTLAEL